MSKFKEYFVYVSEKSHIAISADMWKRDANNVVFYKGEKIIAWFNINNIAGICERLKEVKQ